MNKVEPIMEWYALTKAVVDKLRARGVTEEYLALVPFAVSMGMQRSSRPNVLN